MFLLLTVDGLVVASSRLGDVLLCCQAAVPVEGRCAWTVEFRTMMEGTYAFDATLISWKGGLEQDYKK